MESKEANNFTKFKYMLGEPTYKKKFEGCSMPDGGIEGNTITANNKYIAVSFYIFLIINIDAMESRRWWMYGCTSR